ncbi:hypothetical protein ACWXOO_000657 [Vibrio parahaemolyticus]
MSYYVSTFDNKFKRIFASSYINLDKRDIYDLALQILSSHVSNMSYSIEREIKSILNSYFDINQRYKDVYVNFCLSNKLMALSESSNELHSIPKGKDVRKVVYLKRVNKFYRSSLLEYAKKENINIEFVELAMKRNFLKVITGFFLQRHCNQTLTPQILSKLDFFVETINTNNRLLTPYQKTERFQRFIHELCSTIKGDTSVPSIPSKLMRTILSSTRFHFSYMNELDLSMQELTRIRQKQNTAFDEVNLFDHDRMSPKIGAKYIKNWKQRHQIPIFGWKHESILDEINQIDNDDLMYVNLCIYSSLNIKTMDEVSLEVRGF